MISTIHILTSTFFIGLTLPFFANADDKVILDENQNIPTLNESTSLATGEVSQVNPETLYLAKRDHLKNHFHELFLASQPPERGIEKFQSNIEKLKEMKAAVYKVYENINPKNGQNVHNFDGVYGMYHKDLARITREFNMGEVLEIAQIIEKANSHPHFPHSYVDTNNNKHNCMANLCAGFHGIDAEILSRSVTLAMQLYDQFDGYETGMALMNSIGDNYALHGGCYAGRRDRLLLSLLDMINFMFE